jgi:hypothetical protein
VAIGPVAVDGSNAYFGTAGDFLGEISVVSDMPQAATVTADLAVRLFVPTGRDFRVVLD